MSSSYTENSDRFPLLTDLAAYMVIHGKEKGIRTLDSFLDIASRIGKELGIWGTRMEDLLVAVAAAYYYGVPEDIKEKVEIEIRKSPRIKGLIESYLENYS